MPKKKKDDDLFTNIFLIVIIGVIAFVFYMIDEMLSEKTKGRFIEIGIWLGIFIGSSALIYSVLEENSEDKKLSNDQILKTIIISIIFTCVCAFFWYQIIN